MQLLNDTVAAFMNDHGSQRLIEAQQEGSMLSHEERQHL
jgi:hypothetical protein